MDRKPLEHRDVTPEVEQFPSVRRIIRWLTSSDDAKVRRPEVGHQPHGDASAAGVATPLAQVEASEDESWTLQQADTTSAGPFSRSPTELDFRPTLRPPVPVLTILDDGAQDAGEEHRVREEVCSIGRTSGVVRIPNDISMSGSHAEIRRMPWKGGFQWHLHDVGSVNGTFVRCVRAVLHENAILILGARRFRLRNPLVPVTMGPATGDTRVADGRDLPSTIWPTLAEASGKPDALQFPIRVDDLTIGRAGTGADIELDDPLLADRHAVLRRQRDGTWQITAEQTRNGIWISVTAVPLSSHCFFRCGEQRFRFTIP